MQSRSRGQIQAAQSPGRRLTHLENNWNELLVDNPVSSAPPHSHTMQDTLGCTHTHVCAHTYAHHDPKGKTKSRSTAPFQGGKRVLESKAEGRSGRQRLEEWGGGPRDVETCVDVF